MKLRYLVILVVIASIAVTIIDGRVTRGRKLCTVRRTSSIRKTNSWPNESQRNKRSIRGKWIEDDKERNDDDDDDDDDEDHQNRDSYNEVKRKKRSPRNTKAKLITTTAKLNVKTATGSSRKNSQTTTKFKETSAAKPNAEPQSIKVTILKNLSSSFTTKSRRLPKSTKSSNKI